jgi:hypothetical protein
MPTDIREQLRIIIAVALAVAPKRLKQAFADRYDAKHEAAQKHLSAEAADAVLQSFEVSPKPLPPMGQGVPARPEG